MRTVKTQDIPLIEATADAGTRQDRVYRSLRQAITAGRLQRGDQVPSSRELATRWSLSRGTVEQAYERLTIEGYLERRHGAGTFVAAQLPEHFTLPDTCCRVPSGAPVTPTAAAPLPCPADAPAQLHYCAQHPPGLAFDARTADPELLDMGRWRHHLLAATRRIRPDDMHIMQNGGLMALRRALANYVKGVRGIDCQAEDVIITTGIRQSLGLLASMLKTPTHTVCFEDPCYLHARQLFENYGLNIRSVAVDEEGLRVDELGQATAVYTTPAHQSPLGVTMSASRRAALLDWARHTGALIIEDDYDSEYNYLKSPPPALKSSDQQHQVVFCSSFNKVLYSSLRIGFMIPPPAWRDEIMLQLRTHGTQPGLIEQQALALMIDSGDIYSHIRQSRRVYERRRNLLLQQLGLWIDKPRISGEHCGFHFVLWLPPEVNDQQVAQLLTRHGLFVQPISGFVKQQQQPPGLMLAFAAVPDQQLLEACQRMGPLLAPLYRQPA